MIDCRGRKGAESPSFEFVPWEFSKGELLALDIPGLDPDVILNRRFWIVPVRSGALAGATHEPGARDLRPTEAARTALEGAVRELVGAGRPFAVTEQRVGVRVNLPDRRPVAGRHPADHGVGLVNGLGAKGVLWAPMLARQWADHLMLGRPFDPEVDVRRFWRTTTL